MSKEIANIELQRIYNTFINKDFNDEETINDLYNEIYAVFGKDCNLYDVINNNTIIKNLFQNKDLINNTKLIYKNPSKLNKIETANKIFVLKHSKFKKYLDYNYFNDNAEDKNSSTISNTLKINLDLNYVYSSLFFSKARYNLIYGGAGSGKSYAVADLLLDKILTSNTRIRILYGRKYFAHIKQSQFALFNARINFYNLNDYFNISKQDYKITCTLNNAELIAIGLDDPEKLKSIYDPDCIWIEEATELREEDWQQLDLRLRSNKDNLQMFFTFNPISRKHFLKRTFFEDDQEIELGIPKITKKEITINDKTETLETFILRTNYKHNKYLPAQYVAALENLRTLNPEYYKIYVNAEWGDAAQGWIFKRDFYSTYTELPSDAKGVIYCDPNLSKKQKGDTTAIVKLLYSALSQCYYVEDVVCKSFDDANELLKSLFALYHNDPKIFSICFDGNVNQESQWTQHIRNFSQIYNTPVPVVDYKKYSVDDLSKNAAILWNEGRIKFRAGISETVDGSEFLTQLYSFTSKKNNKTRDDAPDALICAIQSLFDRGYRITNTNFELIKNIL